jgi:hypothetical protein
MKLIGVELVRAKPVLTGPPAKLLPKEKYSTCLSITAEEWAIAFHFPL